MARNASIVHTIPGRMRIRIPSARADNKFLDQARAALRALPHVVEVSSNPLTGSLLVTYPPALQREFEGALTMGNGSPLPFDLKPADPPRSRRRKRRKKRDSELSRAVTDFFTEIDDAIKESTDNVLDLKTLLPLTLAALGITYVRGGKGTPVWLTLMLFAFSSFIALHGGPAGEAEAELLEEEVLG
jgi:hypothetical protein